MGSFILINKDKLFQKDMVDNEKDTIEVGIVDETNTQSSTGVEENSNIGVVEPTGSTMTKEGALALGNELWNYATATYWGDESVWKKHTETDANGREVVVCDTSREEVMTKFTSDFIGKAPKYKYYLDDFIPKNGCAAGMRGANRNYLRADISIKQIDENAITYDVTYICCADDSCSGLDGEAIKKFSRSFIITRVNNRWLIHYYEFLD